MKDEFQDTDPAQFPQDKQEHVYASLHELHQSRILEDAIHFIWQCSSAFAQLPLHFKDSVPDSVRRSYDEYRQQANRLCDELPKRWNAKYFQKLTDAVGVARGHQGPPERPVKFETKDDDKQDARKHPWPDSHCEQ